MVNVRHTTRELQRLWIQAKQDAQENLVRLLNLTYWVIRRRLRYCMAGTLDADVLAQDVLVHVWGRWHLCQSAFHYTNLVYRLTEYRRYNWNRDYQRNQSRLRRYQKEQKVSLAHREQQQGTLADTLARQESQQKLRQQLQAAIAQLGMRESRLVQEYHLEECSGPELQQRYGFKNTHALQARLAKARRRLRRRLAEQEQEMFDAVT